MKRPIIFLAAFALLTLLTSVGAKGQEMQQREQVPAHLTVAFARNFANLNWPVTFYGYVNHAWRLGDTGGSFYVQDNSSASDGRGLYVIYNDSRLSAPLNDEIRVGSFVKVTATRVIANKPNNPLSSGVAMVYHTDCTSIEVISQDNELMVVNASLQGLKAAHFPLATHLVSDAYQHRLVRLTNLKVVDEITNYDGVRSYVVQDANYVRDTLYGAYLQLEVGQSIASMVVVNTRTSYDKLLLRSRDDLTTEHSLFQARHLAGANMPVCFSGVVSFRTGPNTNPATIYMQANDASNNTTGIKLDVHNCPSSVKVGSIITVTADRVILDENRNCVYIPNTEISHISVVHQNAPLRVRNMSLEGMKSTHYPATPQRVMNDIYQHTLVKVSNVTVVELLENSWFQGCVIENANHTRDTISYYFCNPKPTLQVGQTLASVTAVNCRQSGTAYGGMMKLCLRSVDDIDFNIKSIRYARQHLEDHYNVEGVVSYVYTWAANTHSIYIQDNTGGINVYFPNMTTPPSVGDRCIVNLMALESYYPFGVRANQSGNGVVVNLAGNESITPKPLNLHNLYTSFGDEITISEIQNSSNDGIVADFSDQQLMVTDKQLINEGDPYQCFIQLILSNSAYSNETLYAVIYQNCVPASFFTFAHDNIQIGQVFTSLKGILDIQGEREMFMDPYTPHFEISLREQSDIAIAEPHFISLSSYPSQIGVNTGMRVTLRSDEYYSWQLENQGAAPGARIYLHANHSVPNDYNMIDRFLNPLNAPYSGQCPNMELLRIDCTTHPDLQLTRVNENCWSFIMPNEDVAFEGVYWPKKANGSLCEFSDVWEAREGATESPETAPLAYLRAIVTDVDAGWYHIQDAYNHNCNNDELKKYNGILVHASSDGLQVGDNIYLCGYPHLYEWYDGKVVLSDVRVLRKGNYGYIEHAYPTTLAGIVEDYYGSGHSSAKDSRLQDRVVSLSDVHVQMVSEGYIHVSQTIGDETKSAVVTLPEDATITEGSTISQMTVINMTDREDEGYYDAELILRSMDDMPGANEITLSTNRVEFNEFGGTVSVPINIGANLGGTPQLVTDSYNLNFTATMNANHTAIDITVPASNSTENGIGSIQVTVGEISSELLAVVQTGCAPAAFELSLSYMVYPFDDHGQHTLQVRNVAHVQEPYGNHISAELVEIDEMGTDWITLGSWNETSRSFSFSLPSNDYTGSNPRGVKIAVTMTGTDGTDVTNEATVWQNPPAAAMTLSPYEWETGPSPKCVPVTQTFTVFYENAFDQMSYNADYIWLDWNFGYDMFDFYDFNQEFSVEPECIPVDESGFGAATFTVTYMPMHERIQDGAIWARIGEYDFENHEGIPDGAASPQVWVWPSMYDPYFGWEKVTSMEGIHPDEVSYAIAANDFNRQLGDMSDYSGHIYSYEYTDMALSQNNSFYSLGGNVYCISLMGSDYLTWTGWDGLSSENFDPWMDYPESKFQWVVSFDDNGNALIKPFGNQNYCLSYNDIEDYFECVVSGGNPVQIYRMMDGSVPPPAISAASEWFMDGDLLDITLTPAEGATANYWFTETIGEGASGQTDTPVTFTATETTLVEAYSATCDATSEVANHTYYKVNNIADARDDANGEYDYSVKGIVTYFDNEMLFIQDESDAIHASTEDIEEWLYDGDEVILSGAPITQNNGQWLTLANAEYGLTVSGDNTVEPLLTTFADLDSHPELYRAKLVKVEDIIVGDRNENMGYYYLYQGNNMLYLRDTYEGGFPFILEPGVLIDLTAIFVRNLTDCCLDLIIRDDDEDIFVKDSHDATIAAFSNEALSVPNASGNSHIHFCDDMYNPLETNSFNVSSLVLVSIDEGYSVGVNNDGYPVIAVCNAETGEMIYDSYTNFMVWVNDNDNRHFSFLMPNADVTVKVWLNEGSVGDQCNVIFNLADAFGDGWNGNYLVVTDGYGTSQQLTIESGNSATYALPFETGTHIVLSWIDGSWSNECSFSVTYENGTVVYESEELDGAFSFDFYVDCNAAPSEHTITATANPANGGTVIGGGTYSYNETCTLTATPATGYTFLYWAKNGMAVSTATTYTFTVRTDAEYVAYFAPTSSLCLVTFNLADSYGDGWNGNYLVVTDGNGISQQLTIVTDTLAAYTLPFLNGSHLTLSWITGSYPSECSFTANYEDGTLICEITELDQTFSYGFDVACGGGGGSDLTQTSNFAQGWNWWSSYIEASDLMNQLKTGLGTSGQQIKSQTQFTQYNSMLNMWIGQLNILNNEATYMIQTNAACSVELTGSEALPANHGITLNPGWNWIGFPNSTPMSVISAFSTITPVSGDQVKSQNGFAQYNSMLHMWIGNLNALMPGMGLQYQSNASSPVTLVYPDAARNSELVENITNENNYWTNDVHAYPNNMTVTAVVELDDVELQSESYEVAAFANGECRGSARLMFVAPLNRYMAFLTIAGDEASGLHFSLYDVETGNVETCHGASLQYETNAVVGDVETPYVISFRSTTGIDELDGRIDVFPNPVARGENITIGLPVVETLRATSVQIVNALGVVVETVCTPSVQTIAAPNAAGIYSLHITIDGKGTYTRKLVVR